MNVRTVDPFGPRMPVSRRDWFRGALLGLSAAAPAGGGSPAFALDTRGGPCRSVVVLWLNGGPATIDLWDLKPGHPHGGPFREIETAAAGVRIGEHLPRLAACMNDVALIRSLTSKEGDHDRAMHLLRTGYVPQAAIQFPALGAVVAHEIGNAEADLPRFVSIAPVGTLATIGGGFLGPRCSPLVVGEAAADAEGLVIENLERSPGMTPERMEARIGLLAAQEARDALRRRGNVVESEREAARRAAQLMRPEAARAFRLDEERDQVRQAYGRNLFGQGCLLARRLVERGVPFIEVALDGWDTHNNNFRQVQSLAGVLDLGISALLVELRDRGLLESTLVVCQGEFGRTPQINSSTGRDHWPAAFAALLAGGGIRGGQIVGKTSDDGTQVEDRPVRVPDLMASLSVALGIDPMRQNMSNVGRPIRVADPSAQPIREVLR